jgi:frataxin
MKDVTSEASYHQVCDKTLELLVDYVNPIENAIDDADISYSQGVLNINLGSHGIWVINKQTPNRQIWWSSPISGPRRYEYVFTNNENNNVNNQFNLLKMWKYSRNNGATQSNLFCDISSEMLTCVDLDLKKLH